VFGAVAAASRRVAPFVAAGPDAFMGCAEGGVAFAPVRAVGCFAAVWRKCQWGKDNGVEGW
jgi:hypothetical protein